jgi:transposase-like protein
MMAVYFYYRFKESLDDVVELMVTRGFHLSHQTIHNWVHTFGVDLSLKLRHRRHNNSGKKWHMDVPYLRIEVRWCGSVKIESHIIH